MPSTGYSVGTAVLSIVPDFTGLQNAAAKESEKAGKVMGKNIKDAVERALKDSIRGGLNGDYSGAAAKQGNSIGGTLGNTIKARLQAALRSLPPAEIGAVTSAAEQKIRDLRAQIETLASRDIGIEVSSEEAAREIAVIQAELAELSRTNTDLDIKANTDQASRALAQVAAEIERIKNGDATVTVRANVGEFAGQVRRALERAQAALPPIEVGASTTPAQRELDLLRTRIVTLSGRTIGVDIDAADALADLSAIEAQLAELSASTAEVDVDVNATAAAAALAAVRVEVERLRNERATIVVNANVGAFATKVREALEQAQAALPRIEIDADTSEADIRVARLRARLETLASKRIGVDIEAADALSQINAIQEQLTRLSRERADVDIDVDAAAAAAALAAVQAEVDRLGGRKARVDVDSSSLDSFSGRLVILGTLIGSLLPALVPIGGAAIVGIGAVGAASSTALPAVTALFLGLNGIGDALKAMTKVEQESAGVAEKAAASRAQQAQQQASAARQVESAEAGLANTRIQAANAASAASRRVTDARKAEADAAEDAADAAADAAQRVEQANRDLARTEDDVAEAAVTAGRKVADAKADVTRAAESGASRVQSALDRQASAERSLANAQTAALDAQDALTDARREAEESLQDLQLQVEGAALRQRQGILDVQDAQADLAKTIADPKAGASERAQAQLRYDQALQNLKEIGLRQERLQAEQEEAAAKGIVMADGVQDANRKVVDSITARADAEKAAADAAAGVDTARRDATAIEAEAQQKVVDALAAQQRQQRDGAESIATAQQQVTDALATQADTAEQGSERIAAAQLATADAVTAAAEQQRQAAFSIEQSERSLEGARAAAAAAAAGTAVAATAAMTDLQQAMNNLTPTGQAFAAFLLGLRPELDALQAASSDSLLPGLQAGITALLPLMPVFEDILRNVGGALGDLARMAGEALASPEWAPFFAFLRDQGGPLLTQFGQILGNLATAVLPGLVAAFGPLAGEVLQDLVDFTGRFADFLLTAQDDQAFQDFLAYVVTNAPKVADFFGKLADAFVNIIRAMAPMGPVVLAIVGGIAQLIADLPPGVLAAIAMAVIGIAGAFAILGPIISFVSGIIAAVGAGVPIVGAVIAALGGPVTLIIAGIVALGAALIAAYQHSETFRDIVNAAFQAIRDYFVDVWWPAVMVLIDGVVWYFQNVFAPVVTWLWESVFKPAFEGIAAAVKWAWENVIKPAVAALVWYWQNVLSPVITWLWQEIFKPAFEAMGKIVEIAWAIIKIALDALKWYIENVISPIVTWLWHNVIEPAFKGIGDAVQWAWEHVISPALGALKDFFESTLGPAIEKGVSAFTTAWDLMKKAAADPINFVIREIYTNGIKKLFDQVAEAVGSETRLPVIDELAGFARGGWTGPGAMYQAAGVVHADEFVVKKDSRRRFEQDNPGVLDHINQTGRMPGYAKGGIVDLGRWFAGKGARPAEHPAFGGVTPVHKGRGHYEGRAIDLNYGPGGENATEKAFFDKYANALRRAGWTVYWRDNDPKGHSNHLHAEAPTAGFVGDFPGEGVLAGIGDALGGAFSAVTNLLGNLSPVEALKAKMNEGFEGIGAGGPLVDLTKAAITKMVGFAGDKLSSLASGLNPFDGTEDDTLKALGGTAAQNRELVKSRAAARGWTGPQWDALDKLVAQESSYNHLAQNPSSTAYGLFQFLNSTWAGVGGRKTSDAGEQTDYGLKYIAQRYGDPAKAWAFHRANNWYDTGGRVAPKVLVRDQGGIIPPGFSTIFNGTGKDEFAFTNEQAKALLASRQGVGRTAPYIGEQHYHVHGDTDLDLAQRREEFRLTQALMTV